MTETTVQPSALKKRLLSLDVFRGITIATMILVNDPGDWGHIYPPLEHSKWNGCTPTDLVFPFFLFMVGVSIVYAMEKRKEVGGDHAKLIGHAFKRMVILLLINYGMQFFFNPTLTHMRFPGVLPRIAVVYFICSVIYVKTSQKTRDWLFAILLIGYYLVMNFIPVPGLGYANLEPTTNLGAWVDRLVFGSNHLWGQSVTWDPEGLLGTFPAIATGLFGIRLGTWIKRTNVEDTTKVSWMFFYGVLSVVLALFGDLFFPINKQLWTSTFVLYAGGLATIGLAFSYWWIDVQGHKKYTAPIVAFGTNAITAYVLADFIPHYLSMIRGDKHGNPFYHVFFSSFLSPVNASLGSAVFIVFSIWIVMWVLYKRKIIIKV